MPLSLATGGLSWLTDRDRQAAARYQGDLARAGAQLAAAEEARAGVEEAAARGAGEVRGTGTLTKYRPVGGWRTPGPGGGGGETPGKAPNLADVSLGGPTSYRGGAGAPSPVAVMKGTRTTYATEAGGPNLTEFGTPTQAGQAWHREQLSRNLALAGRHPGVSPNLAALREKHGGYVSPEEETLQAAARADVTGARALNLATVAAAKRETEKEGVAKTTAAFDKWLQTTYGQYDTAGKPVKPTDPRIIQAQNRARAIAGTHGEEAAKKDYGESLMVHRFEPLFSPEELAAINERPDFARRFILEEGPKRAQAKEAGGATRRDLYLPSMLRRNLWEVNPEMVP